MAKRKKFRIVWGKKRVKEIKDLNTMTDEEVLAFSLKDPNAFTEIVRRYERLFVRKANEIVHSDDDAFDVVQDTFVRIYAAAKRFHKKGDAGFRSWAYTILVRQCYSLYKKNKRQRSLIVPLSDDVVDIVPDENLALATDQAFSMEMAVALIAKLPSRLQQIVRLYFIDGISQNDIATALHLTPVAVRVRVHRAKRELRRLYRQTI